MRFPSCLLAAVGVVVALSAGPVASAAAPAPTVALTAPVAGAELTGPVLLTASAPRAYAVAFRGRWADADGVRRWHHLGTDRDGSDGFTLDWSPGPVVRRTNVFVGARALARRGVLLGAARSVALRTPQAPVGGDAGGVHADDGAVLGEQASSPGLYRVENTCGAGTCRLTRRAQPRADGDALGTLREGTAVTVRCQIAGGLVEAKAGRSRVWNRLDDGSYVSDLYLDTPGTSGFSAGLPRCGEPVR